MEALAHVTRLFTSPAWFLGWLVTPEQPQFEKGNMIRTPYSLCNECIHNTYLMIFTADRHYTAYIYISEYAPCLHVRATGLFSIWVSQGKSRMNGQRPPGRALNDPNALR